MAKDNLAKIWESTTKVMSTARGTITVKAVRKEEKEERKAKEKDKEKTRNQLQIPVSKATAEHVEDGDTRRVSVGKDMCKLWRKFRVLLRVQLHQVQQPHRRLRRQQHRFKNSMLSRNQGWIFGVMGGSVASVTTGTDNLWDELALDSGSVSTACPYAWCSDISLNNEDKVHLQDIQQRRIPSHGSRVVPLELWGPEGCVECKVKFDVADIAYPVVSLGKMIESRFTFSVDDYKCYMHKGNRRVENCRKGRIFVLRMRRRWLKDKVQMVAPIEEVAAGEMEIGDNGEGAEDARMKPRADEPGVVPPPPRPREVRPSAMRPGEEIVRLHNLTHCPYQSWCEVCVASKGRSDHYHREAPQPIDGDIARIQMDFMFVGAEVTFVDEPRARATVLMVICKDDGNLSATEVRSKTDEYGVEMVIRFLSTYESVEIKTDGEPSIVEVARRVQARRDKTTTLAQTSVGGHQEFGAVERANGTVQAQLRAYFLDVQNRMQVRIIPGTQLFAWMLRHSVWTVVRYQSDQRTKQTPYERTIGCRHESALVPFGEVVMAKIADADKMRAGKLDSAWVKAVWVGRVDRSDEHLLLTTKGCIRSRVVRRIPDLPSASPRTRIWCSRVSCPGRPTPPSSATAAPASWQCASPEPRRASPTPLADHWPSGRPRAPP